jgi:WD40 repeat protein
MESGKWLGISFGPSSGPTDAALSPDGKTFATTGPEETEIREATSGRVLRKLGLGAERLAWSPDGKYLAAAAKKQVTLCDPKTGGIVKRLSSPADPFVAMAPSPDGRSLAALTVASSLIVGNSPDGPGKVFIWDVHSGELRRSFDPQTRFPKSLRWVSDGRTLVVSSQGGLTTFDADSGKLVRKLGSGELPIYSYADDVSADGRLAVQGGPSFIRLRSLPDGRTLLTLLCLRGGRFVLISPDGHYRGDPGVEKELVYVVQTDQGQETLTPEEFAKRYGWKNDPGKARPLPEPDALKPSPQRKPGAEQPKPAR